MRFTSSYREEIALEDGIRVTLRLIRPDDKPRLLEILEALSEHSRTMRFFAPRRHFDERELRYLTELDCVNHLAVIALCGRASVAVARFVRRAPGESVAEPALVVVDRLQARGLGRILLDRLCAAARERGIDRLEGEVLSENRAMLRLLQRVASPVALAVSRSSDGLTCRLDIGARAPAAWSPALAPASLAALG